MMLTLTNRTDLKSNLRKECTWVFGKKYVFAICKVLKKLGSGSSCNPSPPLPVFMANINIHSSTRSFQSQLEVKLKNAMSPHLPVTHSKKKREETLSLLEPLLSTESFREPALLTWWLCRWIWQLSRPPQWLTLTKVTSDKTFTGLWENVGTKTL